MDITTATPVEIDTVIVEIQERAYPLFVECEQIAGALQELRSRTGRYAPSPERIQEVERRLADAQAAFDAVIGETQPYDAEFDRRGGWNRSYWANVANGHLHSSTSCGSLHHGFYRTPMAIEVSMSGKTQNEIVEAVGSQGCTVCYPAAPVEERIGLLSPVARRTAEERVAREAEKTAKRAAQAEKAILDVDGMPLYTVRFGSEMKKVRTAQGAYRFEPVGEVRAFRGDLVKTAVAARNKALEVMFEAAWYSTGNYAGSEHPSARGWVATAEKMIAALAVKWDRTVEDITAEFQAKVAKKLAKEQS